MKNGSQENAAWKRTLLVFGILAALAVPSVWVRTRAKAQNGGHFVGPLSSQSLALSADDSILAVVNPDNNTVSFFRTAQGEKFAEIAVQTEPNGVALTPDGTMAFVANTVSGTVSVIQVDAPGYDNEPHANIPVGVEPYGLVMSPNGRWLYVTNARSNTVSVIDPTTEQVVATIQNVGWEPRGLAITNDGDDDDTDETLYVTQFLALPVEGKIDGADDAKAGRVTVISTATNTVTGEVVLNPIADTGFRAAGDALARIPPGTEFTFVTGAYPNQLNNIAVRGSFAFVPNTGASPNGPVRFNVNTQSLLHVIDLASGTDANKTINMHSAVAAQTNTTRRFITQPWAIAFKHTADEAYVVSAASNVVVKVSVDQYTGDATVQSDSTDPTRVLEIPSGKNPRGIVINSGDTRAYVANYISRDVTVINLETDQVDATWTSASQPEAGSQEETIHIGKELYNTSIGVFDPPAPGQAAISGRMSAAGWGACSACHPNGLSDNVVWIFPAGPRRTISQHADFDPTDPQRLKMRMLNWSANRDEQEDFELNIRAVSGGMGLIVQADGVTQETTVTDLVPLANAGRNQLKVRGVGAWDALKAYIQFGIRAPISPVSKTDPDVFAGSTLFQAANCQSCHAGAQGTSSTVPYTPPPAATLVTNGQVTSELKQVGTFDATQFNEVRQNAAAPLGADGFVPPSIISLFAFPQTFLHNGAAATLGAVLENVTHRSAGTAGVDTLSNAEDRAKLVKYLESLDGSSSSSGQFDY